MAVLDASALLAWIRREHGAESVAAVLEGAALSTVNAAEVAQKLTHHGVGARRTLTHLVSMSGLRILEFTADDALTSAALWPHTRTAGLSLGDRACLALAHRLEDTALTADTAWTRIPKTTGVTVELIRNPHPTPGEHA